MSASTKKGKSTTRRSPSFASLHPASAGSSHAKRANRNRDTQHELLLRRELWKMGLRYRKNVVALPGKPDLVFSHCHVVVFCDGDFWHGRNWNTLRRKLKQGSNPHYWIAKIRTNRLRDRRNVRILEKSGWHVIRLWETDIKHDPIAVARRVKNFVENHVS